MQHSEKPFLVYRDERYTFGETWAHANAVAAALQKQGIHKGDRVVIAMRNYPEWIFSFIGTVLAGGVAVPLNAWWQGQEILDAIEKCGGKRLGFSALYPNLKKLEEKGFVTSRWEDVPAEDNKARKKFFKITGLGVQSLAKREEFLNAISEWQPSFG